MKNIIVVLLLLLGGLACARSQIAVIVNKSVSANSLDASALLDIYSYNKREWRDGAPIVIFTLRGNGSTSDAFYTYIDKKPLDMKKLWMRLQLSGEAKAPTSFSSEEELVLKVASTPGAIAFISSEKAIDGVKLIATIK